MIDLRSLALVSLGFIAAAAAPASAGLISTPTSGPIVNAPPTKQRPAPPATVHYTVADGWRIGIGQLDPSGTTCGGAATFVGEIYPGTNVPFSFAFVRSDGSATRPLAVPAAPAIPGAKLGGKGVRDAGVPARAGLTEQFVVSANGRQMRTEALAVVCH